MDDDDINAEIAIAFANAYPHLPPYSPGGPHSWDRFPDATDPRFWTSHWHDGVIAQGLRLAREVKRLEELLVKSREDLEKTYALYTEKCREVDLENMVNVAMHNKNKALIADLERMSVQEKDVTNSFEEQMVLATENQDALADRIEKAELELSGAAGELREREKELELERTAKAKAVHDHAMDNHSWSSTRADLERSLRQVEAERDSLKNQLQQEKELAVRGKVKDTASGGIRVNIPSPTPSSRPQFSSTPSPPTSVPSGAPSTSTPVPFNSPPSHLPPRPTKQSYSAAVADHPPATPVTPTPTPKVDPATLSPTAFYFDAQRCRYSELRAALRLLGIPGWKIISLYFINRSETHRTRERWANLEVIVPAAYGPTLLRLMQQGHYRHLPHYDPSKAMDPHAPAYTAARCSENFQQRCNFMASRLCISDAERDMWLLRASDARKRSTLVASSAPK